MGNPESSGAFFDMGAFDMGLGFSCILSLGRMVRWMGCKMSGLGDGFWWLSDDN